MENWDFDFESINQFYNETSSTTSNMDKPHDQMQFGSEQQPSGNFERSMANNGFGGFNTMNQEPISIVICYDGNSERDLIPNLMIDIDQQRGISLKSIVDSLRREAFPVVNSKILYLVPEENLFVFCGDENTINEDSFLPMYSINHSQNGSKKITLKIRKAIPQQQAANYQSMMFSNSQSCQSESHFQAQPFPAVNNCQLDVQSHNGSQHEFGYTSPQTQENCNYNTSSYEEETEEKICQIRSPGQQSCANAKRKRHAERTIREVMDLVNYWRSLHQGFVDKDSKKVVKLSLGDAAKKVGVPRKSLDDYLLMMKHAKTNGFNFSANYDQRFGIVRNFVKKIKAQKKSNDLDFDAPNFEEDQNEVKVDLSFTSKKINKFINFWFYYPTTTPLYWLEWWHAHIPVNIPLLKLVTPPPGGFVRFPSLTKNHDMSLFEAHCAFIDSVCLAVLFLLTNLFFLPEDLTCLKKKKDGKDLLFLPHTPSQFSHKKSLQIDCLIPTLCDLKTRITNKKEKG